jgi:hypothetical protein
MQGLVKPTDSNHKFMRGTGKCLPVRPHRSPGIRLKTAITVELIPVSQSIPRTDSGSGKTLRPQCGATLKHRLVEGQKNEKQKLYGKRYEYTGRRDRI